MHTTKLAWIAAVALVTMSACTQPREPEPGPLTNETSSAVPAQPLDSAELPPAPESDPGPPPPLPRTSELVATDAGAPDASAPVKTNVAACIAACEAKYPGGAAKSKLIDKCWTDHCGACQTMTGTTLKTPTSGACQTGVYTPSAECSQCTTDWCCWAWDMCFLDSECKSLNACSVACSK